MLMRTNLILLAFAALFVSPFASAARPLLFVTDSFPPFSRVDHGVVVGPMSDMIQAACERIKQQCNIELMPRRRISANVEARNADGEFPLARIPEREAYWYFNLPIFDTAYSVYAHTGRGFRFRTPADATACVVGTYGPSATSSSAERLLGKVAGIRIVVEVDNLTVLRKLSAGRYGENGLAVINRDIAKEILEREKIPDIEDAGELAPIQYYIGLSKLSVPSELAEHFAQALKELKQSGKLQEIAGHYGLTISAQVRTAP